MWKCLFSTSYKYCFHFYFDSVQTITFQTTDQRQGTTKDETREKIQTPYIWPALKNIELPKKKLSFADNLDI